MLNLYDIINLKDFKGEGIIIEFKYSNTMDEYLNGYKLVLKLSKNYFIRYKLLPRMLIILCIVYIILQINEILIYPFSIQPYLWILLMSYLLYRFSRVEKVFIKSIEKKLGVKSVIFKELTCIVEDNRFMYAQGNNRIEVLFSQIYKVIEDNNAIYIFGEEYLILLIIPNSVFKTSEEKNQFIKKMEVYNA